MARVCLLVVAGVGWGGYGDRGTIATARHQPALAPRIFIGMQEMRKPCGWGVGRDWRVSRSGSTRVRCPRSEPARYAGRRQWSGSRRPCSRTSDPGCRRRGRGAATTRYGAIVVDGTRACGGGPALCPRLYFRTARCQCCSGLPSVLGSPARRRRECEGPPADLTTEYAS